jgi:hypothetical protein
MAQRPEPKKVLEIVPDHPAKGVLADKAGHNDAHDIDARNLPSKRKGFYRRDAEDAEEGLLG